METVIVYWDRKIENFDDFIEIMSSGVPACDEPPEKGTCECKKCFEYEITIKRRKIKKMMWD